MSKISCETIMDLIPLVKDDAASGDSKILVGRHMETCESCRGLYNSFESFQSKDIVMNEKDVIEKMKKQIFIVLLITIVIFAMAGLALSESMGMFYNILIMPIIGVIGYFAFSKRPQIVLIALFIFSYIWFLIKYIAGGLIGEGMLIEAVTTPIFWSMLYIGLAGIGIVIGFLLKYTFGKENIYEKQN